MSADIAAVLEAHTYDYPDSFCECGHFVGARPWKDHAAHVAEQLAPVIAAAQAEAWGAGYVSGSLHEFTGNPFREAAR